MSFSPGNSILTSDTLMGTNPEQDKPNKAACVSCREKKLKCDKVYPVCSRCNSRKISCIYVSHKKKGPKPISARVVKTKVSQKPTKNNQVHGDSCAGVQDTNWRSPTGSGSTLADSNLGDKSGTHTFSEDTMTKMLMIECTGLTLKDIDELHKYYFDSDIRSFMFSSKRYLHKYRTNPQSILYFSYFIWAATALNIPKCRSKALVLYTKGIELMERHWERYKHSDELDTMYYLQCMSVKAHCQYRLNLQLESALTICSAVRLAQLFGYDQIDSRIGRKTGIRSDMDTDIESFDPSPDSPVSAVPIAHSSCVRSKGSFLDDGLDSEITLAEEARRTFWEVYIVDKWYSAVSGMPCAFSIDSNSVIFTLLPSPTTFLSLTGELDQSQNEGVQSFHLHEAMQKLEKNEVLIDLNSLSSKILLFTISENITKWCKMFLYMVDVDSLKYEPNLKAIINKVDELVKNFEALQSNLLLFDLNSAPLITIVVTNTVIMLYQTVVIKFCTLFDIHQSVISDLHFEFFKKLLNETCTMSTQLIKKFNGDENFEENLSKASVSIVFTNCLRSVYNIIAIAIRFEKVIVNLDINQSELLGLFVETSAKLGAITEQSPDMQRLDDALERWIYAITNKKETVYFLSSMS
ncbi:hypothetical protein CANARDRAFT_165850 [[Candida] arabinofermentans NRRL YB-2248]|uniref:Zn(2)-C6 fungal-type domain-containing protein n=1 Tax=[Candida] arabinofermentans NRRL YB-2248 TaxID=983967 RepID=A0A1E4T0Q8_9ASCO|nr:hypothetical protein CANARDRAFT_165850 [[Candida] arabinofermentans NRRL YB-2248]